MSRPRDFAPKDGDTTLTCKALGRVGVEGIPRSLEEENKRR